MNVKQLMPWWAKIGAKLVLSRLPVSYRFWQRLNLFVHGQMNREEYAWNVVTSHLQRVGLEDLRGGTVLEFGPGDSLFTAVIARSLGAERTLLVDAGAFASFDLRSYRRLSCFLSERGLPGADLDGARSLQDVLDATGALYLVEGTASLRAIESQSVDLIFSQAVMEHIRVGEVAGSIAEFRRILKPKGMTSHQVDLKDHLGGALNNLRFSDAVWESQVFASSGFYTNRLRFREFLNLFTASGFEYSLTDVKRWPRLPTPRRALARRFAELPDDDLLVSQFDIVAWPRQISVGTSERP